MAELYIDATASVSATASFGSGSAVWGLAQVREGARVGPNCTVGRGAYIGAGVKIGESCKIQNGALVYEPARLGNGVFIGPGVILTNDEFPRSTTPEGELKRADDWTAVGVIVEDGASIGAGSVCIAPVTIGAWALVGAGSTVVNDVAPFSLVVGSPARHIGWVGRSGKRLQRFEEVFVCPATGERYEEMNGTLSIVETT